MGFSVVCWKWRPVPGYRSKFSAEHVNVLRAMVERHFHMPHEFVCVTDDPAGIDPRVRVVKLWDDYASVPSPHGEGAPSCYRRLRAFSKETGELLGGRFVSLDLDCVITGDVTPVWWRPERDFMIWHGTTGGNPYNGSMWMMDAGARAQVWEKFDPVESPRLARQCKFYGSDQAWIAACLGRDEKVWKKKDGVFSYRKDVVMNRGRLPQNARIVFFHGSVDPWSRAAQRGSPWIREHWKL